MAPIKIGLHGGAFNPPHNGHLACVHAALEQCQLNRVLWVPYANPAHRDIPCDPGAKVRLELCRLALKDQPQIEVSDIELQRDGISYTIDTLKELEQIHPAASFTLILGADAALQLPNWYQPSEILRRVDVVVLPRVGIVKSQLARIFQSVEKTCTWMLLELPELPVSSTEIRQKIVAGDSIHQLVPAAVEHEIRHRLLYSHR